MAKRSAGPEHDKDSDAPKGISRRSFMARGVAVGAAARAAWLGLPSRPAAARTSGPVRVGASRFEPLEVDSPMARWKKPQSFEFIEKATKNCSFPSWQSGSEDSIFYNLNIPEFFKCSYVAPPKDFSELERAPNQDEISGIDHSPGYLRNAAKTLAGESKRLMCTACRRAGRSAMQS
ncbi:hypothetical protein [Tateyamaria pelophila]|uniref:hypothetical protein n=1 Tax=Tateyamaria pelophila TaxID=328415 RepID=UPI001CBE8A7D|nr:hypothetical protein [Tateyamaria pelophila]